MKSISKNKRLWPPFIRALDRYQLLADGDKVAVCVSGGKDSFALAVAMQELCRQSRLAGRQNFDVIFLCLDPGYSPTDRQHITATATALGLPLEIISVPIFRAVQNAGGTPCYLCARMRRGHLYAAARDRGCNKIALAHHQDDIAETILMNLFRTGQQKTMPPKLPSKNFPGLSLIRPFCLVREKDLCAWRDQTGLAFIHGGCPLGKCDDHGERAATKRLLATLEQTNPHLVHNIYHAFDPVKK